MNAKTCKRIRQALRAEGVMPANRVDAPAPIPRVVVTPYVNTQGEKKVRTHPVATTFKGHLASGRTQYQRIKAAVQKAEGTFVSLSPVKGDSATVNVLTSPKR